MSTKKPEWFYMKKFKTASNSLNGTNKINFAQEKNIV